MFENRIKYAYKRIIDHFDKLDKQFLWLTGYKKYYVSWNSAYGYALCGTMFYTPLDGGAVGVIWKTEMGGHNDSKPFRDVLIVTEQLMRYAGVSTHNARVRIKIKTDYLSRQELFENYPSVDIYDLTEKAYFPAPSSTGSATFTKTKFGFAFGKEVVFVQQNDYEHYYYYVFHVKPEE